MPQVPSYFQRQSSPSRQPKTICHHHPQPSNPQSSQSQTPGHQFPTILQLLKGGDRVQKPPLIGSHETLGEPAKQLADPSGMLHSQLQPAQGMVLPTWQPTSWSPTAKADVLYSARHGPQLKKTMDVWQGSRLPPYGAMTRAVKIVPVAKEKNEQTPNPRQQGEQYPPEKHQWATVV